MQSKGLLSLADMIQGEINRICVTNDIKELSEMTIYAERNIHKLYSIRYEDLTGKQEEKAKKKLTFTERQKITREYHEWCLINNAIDCAESFLAFLCIKGYL